MLMQEEYVRYRTYSEQHGTIQPVHEFSMPIAILFLMYVSKQNA